MFDGYSFVAFGAETDYRIDMKRNKLENPVLMGVIGAAHGIKGQCRVKSFSGDPLALGDYGTVYSADGRAFDIKDIRESKNVVVVGFDQVKDRNMAESLNGTELFIDRSQLPDDVLEEDEFYIEDLVGMDALDGSGRHIGVVSAIHNFGAGDMIEVAVVDQNGELIAKTEIYPFTKHVVPTIDFENWAITLIAPGEIIVAPEGSSERANDPDSVEDGT